MAKSARDTDIATVEARISAIAGAGMVKKRKADRQALWDADRLVKRPLEDSLPRCYACHMGLLNPEAEGYSLREKLMDDVAASGSEQLARCKACFESDRSSPE